jgi:hypothetical protein
MVLGDHRAQPLNVVAKSEDINRKPVIDDMTVCMSKSIIQESFHSTHTSGKVNLAQWISLISCGHFERSQREHSPLP